MRAECVLNYFCLVFWTQTFITFYCPSLLSPYFCTPLRSRAFFLLNMIVSRVSIRAVLIQILTRQAVFLAYWFWFWKFQKLLEDCCCFSRFAIFLNESGKEMEAKSGGTTSEDRFFLESKQINSMRQTRSHRTYFVVIWSSPTLLIELICQHNTDTYLQKTSNATFPSISLSCLVLALMKVLWEAPLI